MRSHWCNWYRNNTKEDRMNNNLSLKNQSTFISCSLWTLTFSKRSALNLRGKSWVWVETMKNLSLNRTLYTSFNFSPRRDRIIDSSNMPSSSMVTSISLIILKNSSYIFRALSSVSSVLFSSLLSIINTPLLINKWLICYIHIKIIIQSFSEKQKKCGSE